MARLAMLGGSYVARSPIANCRRCVNYFPEHNPQDSPSPVTHYQRPGFRPLVQGPLAPVRGLHRTSQGQGLAVIGNTIQQVNADWSLTQIGQLVTSVGPTKFSDNGTTGLLVDGSPVGWTVDLASGTVSQFVDPTGTFQGANWVQYLDTYLLWNFPGTNKFGSTLSNVLTIDPTYVAAKTGFPDPIQALIVNHHELYLLGQVRTEPWYNAGNPTFPFALLPGAYCEHGTVAQYSVAAQDTQVYWLGQDESGQGVVFKLQAYNSKRISNHALEFAIRQIARASTITDAIGYCYQLDGHWFYVLVFPSGNQTWVWDESSESWHQRSWNDEAGGMNRDRSNCAANLYGRNVVGDWENGTIYELDPTYYVDTMNGVDWPIVYVLGFPHIGVGDLNLGGVNLTKQVTADGKRVQFNSFVLDLQCGNAPLDAAGNPAVVSLRWSDDKGQTFGEDVLQSAGGPGEYLTQPLWRGVGIARDRVFEITHQIAGEAACNGAWVDGTVLGT